MTGTPLASIAIYAMNAVKLLALVATLSGALSALIAAIASVDGACPSEAFEVIINAVPLAQLLLLKAGLDRDPGSPADAAIIYALTILCLVPQAGAAAMCWG